MVKFYQSWCGHCMRMKPDWDQLADQASESILIADVDCGKEEGVSYFHYKYQWYTNICHRHCCIIVDTLSYYFGCIIS